MNRAILLPTLIAVLPVIPLAQMLPSAPKLAIKDTKTNAVTVSLSTQPGSAYLLQGASTVLGVWRSQAGLIQATGTVESANFPSSQAAAFFRGVAVNKIISLVETNSGNNLQVTRGDVLEITLDANPSTGYTWELATESTPKAGIISPVTYVPGSGLGSSGKMIFHIEHLGQGQGELRLIYHRPFDKVTPPLKTFALNLAISP